MARLRYKNFFAMPAVEPDDDRVGIVVGLQFNFKERTNKWFIQSAKMLKDFMLLLVAK